MIKTGLVILLFFVVISFSCDAPKNNPLHSGANTIPIVTEFNVYSITIDRYTLSKDYRIGVKAKILDRNDIVDSVFIEIPYFKTKKLMDFNIQEHAYEKTLLLKDLNNPKPDEIVGQPFRLIIKDIASRLYEGKSVDIKRIIKDDLIVSSPLGGDTTETSPVLKWKNFEGGFSHVFYVQVLTKENIPLLVWQKDNIPSDSLSVKVDIPLPVNEYVWRVGCKDLFNNRAVSRDATFNVR